MNEPQPKHICPKCGSSALETWIINDLAAFAAANSQLDDAGSHNEAADRELRELRQQLASEREQHKKDIGALIESHAAKVLSKVNQ